MKQEELYPGQLWLSKDLRKKLIMIISVEEDKVLIVRQSSAVTPYTVSTHLTGNIVTFPVGSSLFGSGYELVFDPRDTLPASSNKKEIND